MALLKGRLFAGALFAGALFSSQVSVEPPIPIFEQVPPGVSGGVSGPGRGFILHGHTWVEVPKIAKVGFTLPIAGHYSHVSVDAVAGQLVEAEAPSASVRCVTDVSVSAVSGGIEVVAGSVFIGSGVDTVTISAGAEAPKATLEYVGADEIIALLVA